MPTFRVFVVDDDPIFLTLAELCLGADPRITVVGHACSGAAALEQIPQLQPDVVFMDVQLGRLNGFEATRRLKACPHAPKVIVMSSSEYGTPLRIMAEAVGADGCLIKLAFLTHARAMIHALLDEAAAVCAGSGQERRPVLCRCVTQ